LTIDRVATRQEDYKIHEEEKRKIKAAVLRVRP